MSASSPFHDGARRLQDRFDTRRLADRLDERFVQRARHRRRRPRVHRADGHVLPRDGRRRGPAAVLLQGRRARLRARARRAHDRVPQLRRQRHVPVDGQRRSSTRTSACCSSTSRERPSRLRLNGEASIDERRPADGATTRARSSSCACAATQVFPNCPRYIHRMELVERSRFVPRRRRRDAGAGVEANGLGVRRAARARRSVRPEVLNELAVLAGVLDAAPTR